MANHHLLRYEYVEDMLDRRGPYREAHLAHIGAAKDAGRVVMAGAIGDPPHGGVIVFKGVEPELIEAYVQDDPYKTAGLITAHHVDPWNLV
jgi:uncharacterized protein YciI